MVFQWEDGRSSDGVARWSDKGEEGSAQLGWNALVIYPCSVSCFLDRVPLLIIYSSSQVESGGGRQVDKAELNGIAGYFEVLCHP